VGRGETLSRPTVGTIGEEEDAAAEQGAGLPAGLRNAAITGMIQDKLDGLVGRSSGYVESLPDAVRRRVEGLKGLNVEHQKLEAEFQREILALEKKFADKYKPLYDKRAQIVLGSTEPTAAEVEAGEATDERPDEEQDEDEEAEERGEEARRSLANISIATDAPKGIPEFWLTALKNHMALSELITERDEEALRHLTDVRLRYLDGPEAGRDSQAGFVLDFVFDAAANPHFTNEVLSKTYFYQDEVGFSGDLVYDHAEGSKIDWKSPEMDLTHRIETKKQRNKNTNETRTVKRLVPTDSFFNFFSPPKPPKDEDEDEEEDEELDEIEDRLELDYQVGEDLKDRIIPHAVDFFTGKALHYENPEEWDDEGEDEDDLEDDDDDDDDGDEAGAGQRAAAQPSQECKQQ